MNFLVITSTKDTASMNIRDKLLNNKQYFFEEGDSKWYNNPVFELKSYLSDQKKDNYLGDMKIYIGLTNERLIYLNDLKLGSTDLNPDFIIFASRHTSKTARPALLIHTTGNWSDDTEFGGEPYDLSSSSALLLKAGFLSLMEEAKNQNLKNFAMDIEVTHHGPTVLKKPLVYMELGSSKKEWENSEAGLIVANAIVASIFRYVRIQKDSENKVGLGFGGTHYAPNFSRLMIEKNLALSFICPKYYIQNLTDNLIKKMIKNTFELVDFFIIDWKGTNSQDKKHLIPILEKFTIPIKKIKEF